MAAKFGGGGGRGGRFATVERPEHPVATLRRLLGILRDRRMLMLSLLIPLMISSVAGIIWPSVIGKATDLMKLDSPEEMVDFRRLAIVLLGGTIAVIVNLTATVVQGYGTTLLSNLSVRDMRRKLFKHIQALPLARFDTVPHGEFMSRLTNDIDLVANTLGQGILNFIGSLLTLAATFAFMLWLSPIMTLVACATFPLTFVFGRFLVRISRKLFRARQSKLGELNGFAEEMISGQRVVQAYCRENLVVEQFNDISAGLRDIGIKAETLGGFMGPSMNLINNTGFILVVAIGGWLALRSEVSIGIIIAFTIYTKQFGRPINELAMQFNQIQSAIAGAERVFSILDMPKETDEGKIILETAGTKGGIVFENVSFAYTPGTWVLKDFSLEVKPHTKVALVGETGSGKTTVVNLLTRFYETTQGRILLDGVDIREISKPSLRSCMAMVPQDTHLFSGTVAENIAFGTKGATREQIVAAAKLAYADIFIERLPQGYDTFINQTDTALSQGQCQLLAIARAALADPAILILDEATSSVDTRTEVHIRKAMLRLMHGRTSIVVAHRLSTIRDANMILVMDNGRIAESGNHEQLIARDGIYAALCRR